MGQNLHVGACYPLIPPVQNENMFEKAGIS